MNEYAVTFTERETAKLLPVDIDIDAIGANEVAGHTLATLISAGTELNSGYLGDNFPRQSGYAAAFKVEKVGENVSGISPGRPRLLHRQSRILPAETSLAGDSPARWPHARNICICPHDGRLNDHTHNHLGAATRQNSHHWPRPRRPSRSQKFSSLRLRSLCL